MKRIVFRIVYGFACLGVPCSIAEAQDSLIQHVIDEVNLDTLIHHVRILSGEDSVLLGSQKYRITNRSSSSSTHHLAGDYIKQTLEGYGLAVTEQNFTSGGLAGRNIYAIQPGTLNPSVDYIICAHYDAVPDYAADDNASGCAAVLESARLLSRTTTTHTVVYALWDMEEIGLRGSEYYASNNTRAIGGVLNLEMFGWDGDNDGKMDIHVRNYANSVSLANGVKNLDSVFSIGLSPVIYNPGAPNSDHGPFWDYNYSATAFSQAYYGGDFNPYYHSSNDRISRFNLPFFHRLARLAAASIAYYARLSPTDVAEEGTPQPLFALLQNYPNPFNSTTTIRYQISQRRHVTLKVFSILGCAVATLVQGVQEPGEKSVQWDASNVASGVYFYRLDAGGYVSTKRMFLLR